MVKKLISFFIPEKEYTDVETLRKANLTVGTFLIVAYFTLNYVLISYIIDFQYGRDAQFLMFLISGISLVLFKYGINKSFIHFLFFISATITILITVYYSGGFESYTLPWLASTPIVALLIWGKKGSLISLIFVISVTVWLYYIYSSGNTLDTFINKIEYRKPFYLSCVIGLILILYFIAFVFENAKNNAMEQLRITQKQLIIKEKLASLGEITAGIAHELQNPLNFVNNFAQLNDELIAELKDIKSNKAKKEKTEEDDELIEELLTYIAQNQQKINFHGSRASDIIKKMLEHSGSGTIQKKPVDLNALLKEVLLNSLSLLNARNPEINIEYKLDLEDGINEVNVSQGDMSLVFSNLFSNSYIAMQEKTYADKTYKPVLNVSSKKYGNAIEIRIKDNGTGIPENIGKKIFQPFFTTRDTGKGTGLGLSTSYDIITKMHKGDIAFESEVGEFTEFIIKIPA